MQGQASEELYTNEEFAFPSKEYSVDLSMATFHQDRMCRLLLHHGEKGLKTALFSFGRFVTGALLYSSAADTSCRKCRSSSFIISGIAVSFLCHVFL